MGDETWSVLINMARSDLAAAKLLVSPGQFHNACFHAQQAAEKNLKAVLIRHELAYPKTHDIGALVDLVRTVVPLFPQYALEAETLTQFGVEARYGEHSLSEFNEEIAREAIAYATAIVSDCDRHLGV